MPRKQEADADSVPKPARRQAGTLPGAMPLS